MTSDNEWNWLFNYYYTEMRVAHPADIEQDTYHDEFQCEPNEYETDPQYGTINRKSYQ